MNISKRKANSSFNVFDIYIIFSMIELYASLYLAKNSLCSISQCYLVLDLLPVWTYSQYQ